MFRLFGIVAVLLTLSICSVNSVIKQKIVKDNEKPFMQTTVVSKYRPTWIHEIETSVSNTPVTAVQYSETELLYSVLFYSVWWLVL